MLSLRSVKDLGVIFRDVIHFELSKISVKVHFLQVHVQVLQHHLLKIIFAPV